MLIYNIPIIQSDLRHEETIIQAINSLEHLQNVINAVFDRINCRIATNISKIEEINERILAANTQVENLIGINKAINIFSSPKYPAADLFRNIELTFVDDQNNNDDVQVHINDGFSIKNSLDPANHKNIHGKLQFYHVKGKNEPKIKMNKILSPPIGLGKLPFNIQSVNSLLIFNTDQNPYECYNQIDPLLNNDKRHRSIKILSNQNELDAVPFSITHRKSMVQKQDFLLYIPSVTDAPELDLPVDLPDLPGVVDDVVFNLCESDIPIRPSRKEGPPPPDLPEIEELTPDSSPAPPAPPVVAEGVKAASVAKQNQTAAPTPPPPPPPLPPAFSFKEDINANTRKCENTVKPSNENSDDVRSNLMDAIRKAGGRAIRITMNELVPSTSVKNEESKHIKSPGDLMSDLHNKLAARRKGISGLHQENDVASSISSMIPPPVTKLNSSQSNTEASDEDWD